MRILLIGDFSGLHVNLKIGLESLGHEVALFTAGDGWKSISGGKVIPSGRGVIGSLKALVGQIKLISSLRNYDVVQFIFPHIFNRYVNDYFIETLIKDNNKSFLVAAGSDAFYENVQSKFRYSPHFDHNVIDKGLPGDTTCPRWFRDWNNKLIRLVNGVIPVCFDYRAGYFGIDNLLPSIPMPVEVCGYEPKYFDRTKPVITILHGVSRPGFKGSRYIQEALICVERRYGKRVRILTPQRLALSEYMQILVESDIVVDQALTYSYGMNAIISCALGKVTLSGAEPECLNEMGLSSCPIINILPSASDIEYKLCALIDNLDLIEVLSHDSREFVIQHHNAKRVASRYIEAWMSFCG